MRSNESRAMGYKYHIKKHSSSMFMKHTRLKLNMSMHNSLSIKNYMIIIPKFNTNNLSVEKTSHNETL